jgi:hypothetical protein
MLDAGILDACYNVFFHIWLQIYNFFGDSPKNMYLCTQINKLASYDITKKVSA